MKDLNYLIGRTVKSAKEDEFGCTIEFSDGSIFTTSLGTIEKDGEKQIKLYSEFEEKENKMISENNYSIAQLCEISYIAGQLEERGAIKNTIDDLEEMFHCVYKPILNEWEHGITNDIFINREEEGYISAYAQRRLVELYGEKTK